MSVAVERIVLNPRFGSNCYVVGASEEAAVVAVVDPGGDPAPLLAQGRAMVGGILVTHCDVDHIEGVAALAQGSGAEVWVPVGEAADLRSGQTRGGYAVEAHAAEHEVGDGETIAVAGIEFEVVAVPGHSRDHVAFHVAGSLFSGDLLFAGSVGRTDLDGGDWPTLIASITGLLDRFGADLRVYPGHGEPTTLGREIETNPFLGELRTAR